VDAKVNMLAVVVVDVAGVPAELGKNLPVPGLQGAP
jgi:hypothetical protein